MMHFLSVKWGSKYGPQYVNNLFSMIHRHYRKPFDFFCFTDDDTGLHSDIKCEPIPDIYPFHPQYWFGHESFCWDRPKFLLLNASEILFAMNKTDQFCYFDLDVIIQKDITELSTLAHKPRLIFSKWQPPHQERDRFFKNIRGTYFNSSCMVWSNMNNIESVYDDILEHKNTICQDFFKGTDNYHYWRQRAFWKNIPFDWVYSFNRGQTYPNDITPHVFRPEAKLCLFNIDRVPVPQKTVNLEQLEHPELYELWTGRNLFYKLSVNSVQLEIQNKDHTLTLSDIHNIFTDEFFATYTIETVLIWGEITQKTATDYDKIVAFFRDKNIIVYEEAPKPNISVSNSNNTSIPIYNENSLQMYRKSEPIMVKEQPRMIDCQAKKYKRFFLSATGHVYPCYFIYEQTKMNPERTYTELAYPESDSSIREHSLVAILQQNRFLNHHMDWSLRYSPEKACYTECGVNHES